MRGADGLTSSVFLATTLPETKVVVVTFGVAEISFSTCFSSVEVRSNAFSSTVVLATGFLTATLRVVALAGVEVLRVRVLRAGLAVVDLDAVDLTGIGIDSDVYPHIIPNKKPLLRGLLHNVVKKSSLLTVLISRFKDNYCAFVKTGNVFSIPVTWTVI